MDCGMWVAVGFSSEPIHVYISPRKLIRIYIFPRKPIQGGRADNEPCQSIPLTQERSWTESFRRTTLAFAFGEGFALAALSLDCLVCLVLDLS